MPTVALAGAAKIGGHGAGAAPTHFGLKHLRKIVMQLGCNSRIVSTSVRKDLTAGRLPCKVRIYP